MVSPRPQYCSIDTRSRFRELDAQAREVQTEAAQQRLVQRRDHLGRVGRVEQEEGNRRSRAVIRPGEVERGTAPELLGQREVPEAVVRLENGIHVPDAAGELIRRRLRDAIEPGVGPGNRIELRLRLEDRGLLRDRPERFGDDSRIVPDRGEHRLAQRQARRDGAEPGDLRIHDRTRRELVLGAQHRPDAGLSFQIELELVARARLDADALLGSGLGIRIGRCRSQRGARDAESQNEGAGDAWERAEHDGRWLSTPLLKVNAAIVVVRGHGARAALR
jgi:hypothetical protein